MVLYIINALKYICHKIYTNNHRNIKKNEIKENKTKTNSLKEL